MSKEEVYEYEVGPQGSQGLDLLDLAFNQSTIAFTQKYIKPGMTVLDVGCGTGVMSRWFATQVGPEGKVIAIDNSEDQLLAAKKITEGLKNIDYQCLSAYDIFDLHLTFDLIYCRFVLHHLHSPRKTIRLFYDTLNSGGIYIGEEGIISAAFAYPSSFAWTGYMPTLPSPHTEQDGENRDGDFGMKLFYYAKQAGFDILDCQLVQPLLWKRAQKILVVQGLKEFKKTALAQGMTEQEWQNKHDETLRLIQDDDQIIAFYQSCQVAAKK